MKALALLLLTTLPASADVVIAARTLPAGSVIQADDLLTVPGTRQATFADMAGLVGLELRQTVYSGHPIMAAQIGAPIVVERNATVALFYYNHGITLAAEARALDSAGAGETIRVLNLASHRIVTGIVQGDGTVLVSGSLLPSS